MLHQPNPIHAFPPSRGRDPAATRLSCFSVIALAEPCILPRVFDVLAKRSLVPARCHATAHGSGADGLHIDLQVAGLDGPATARIAALLRAIVGVEAVLVSERRQRLSA
jgi:hypothetical protein